MRISIIILSIFLSSISGFCQNKGLNQFNADGRKNGLWRYTRIDTIRYVYIFKIPGQTDRMDIDTINVLQGNYVNGLKSGIWSTHLPGEYRSEVTFVNDTLNGTILIFYDEGNLHMQGEVKPGFNLVHFNTYSKQDQFCGWREFPLEEIIEKYTNLDKEEE